jgi:hypothetical protein
MFGFRVDRERGDMETVVEVSPENMLFFESLPFIQEEAVSDDDCLVETIETALDDVDVNFFIAMRHEEETVSSGVVFEERVSDAVELR